MEADGNTVHQTLELKYPGIMLSSYGEMEKGRKTNTTETKSTIYSDIMKPIKVYTSKTQLSISNTETTENHGYHNTEKNVKLFVVSHYEEHL